MNITSRKIAKENKEKTYFTGKPCKHGHVDYRYTSTGNCIVCLNESCDKYYAENAKLVAARSVKWKAENKEKVIAGSKKYCAKNKTKLGIVAKNWRINNPERDKNNKINWMGKNKELYKKTKRIWCGDNKELLSFLAAKRRCAVLSATPKWADLNEIKNIYANRPEHHHVDHFVPLRGLTPDGFMVSGLHVHYNLRYLTAAENLSRCNRINPQEMLELETTKVFL